MILAEAPTITQGERLQAMEEFGISCAMTMPL